MLVNLSTFNSDEIVSNAEWTNTMKKPITISNGTQITLKQAFLDSASAGQYQVIQIPQDMTITMAFGFVVQYIEDIMKNLVDTPPLGNNELYIALDPASKAPILSYNTFVLPAGNYGPQDLAVIITKQLAQFNNTNISEFNAEPGLFMRPSQAVVSVSGPDINTTDPPYSIYEFTTIPLKTTDPMVAKFSQVGLPITFKCFNTGRNKMFSGDCGTITVVTQKAISGDLVTLTINSTVLNKNAGLEIDPFGFNTLVKVQLIETGSTSNLTFYNQTNIADSFQFKPVIGTSTNGLYVGSSQVALLFNNESSNRFEITAHSPIYEKSTDASPQIYGYTVAGDYYFADKFSSTPFFSLEPASFWSSLGFDLDKVLIKMNTTTNLPSNAIITGLNTSGAFVTYDAIIAGGRATYAIPTDTPFYYGTNLFKNIIADTNYQASNAGYYLLELSNIQTTEYMDDSETRIGIFALISKNYDTSGYITVYGGSEILTINSGSPYLLQSIRVRILDPNSKLPLSNALLGLNNSVYLEILTPSQQPQ
jgi:hypothetical protein